MLQLLHEVYFSELEFTYNDKFIILSELLNHQLNVEVAKRNGFVIRAGVHQ